MDLEKIFKLVRKEEVVLWVGSGFSRYAGYKMGNALAATLYNELSEGQKNEVEPTLPLPDMAEQFVRFNYGNKNELFRILRNEYEKQPTSLKYHTRLSQIPHFKTIITTNYDPLFNLAYKNSCQIIFKDIHLATLDKKTEVIKAHGDLSDLTSVIITKSDYEDYFFNQKNNPLLWTMITQRITSKAILFVGYNMDDSNVNLILKKISEALGAYKREIFFVAPKIPLHKINHLVRQGIQYIDMTGEAFIDKLYKDIRKNIKKDFDKNFVSAETFRRFVDPLDLDTKISFDSEHQIAMLSPKLGKKVKGSFSLSFFKEQSENVKRFEAFMSGEYLDDFVIDKTAVASFEILMAGISLTDFSETDSSSFVLQRKPSLSGQIKVIFSDRKEFDNLLYKAYKVEVGVKIILSLKQANLTFTIPSLTKGTYTVNFHYEKTENYSSINNALFNYELLEKMYSGSEVTIYFYKNGRIYANVPLEAKTRNIVRQKKAKEVINYLKDLKAIEKYFGVCFDNISEKDINGELVKHLKNIIKNNLTSLVSNEEQLIGIGPKGDLNELKSYIADGYFFVMEGDWENVDLHGQTIELGYPVKYIRKPRLDDTDDKGIFSLRSQADKFDISYYSKRFVPNKIALVKQFTTGALSMPD